MSTETTEALIERVLRGAGLTDKPGEYDSDIHGWRCSHPDIYGPCSCFQELRDDLAAAITQALADARADWASSLLPASIRALYDTDSGRLDNWSER